MHTPQIAQFQTIRSNRLYKVGKIFPTLFIAT